MPFTPKYRHAHIRGEARVTSKFLGEMTPREMALYFTSLHPLCQTIESAVGRLEMMKQAVIQLGTLPRPTPDPNEEDPWNHE